MNHPQCVYDRLKMQVFSFKTKCYSLTNQLHVLATVSRRQQADYKNIKRKKLQCFAEISDLALCYIQYMMYMICVYEELNYGV